MLVLAIDRDPAPGVTISNAPYSDEGWRAVNARNLVLLGTWTTDDWAFHLIQLPLSVAQAAVFSVAGVGLVQVRAISVAATVAMAAVMAFGLRRPLGAPGAIAAACAVTFAPLTLFYGRLALLEPPVTLALTIGAVLAIRMDGTSRRRWAVALGSALGLALLLKVNAATGVIAILGLVAVEALRDRDLRSRLGIAIVTIAAWLLAGAAVILPRLDEVRPSLSVLPRFAIPHGPGEWLRNVVALVRSGDHVLAGASALWVGTAIALGILLVGWRWADRNGGALPRGTRRVAALGLAWAGLGLLGVASFEYQPNRYLVPILPAFALVIGAAVSIVDRHLRRRTPGRRSIPLASTILTIGVVAGLVLPGISLDMSRAFTGRRAIDGQAAVAAVLPEGARVAGVTAPLFAMTSVATATLPLEGTTMNDGDLYAAGYRWALGSDARMPSWLAGHDDVWAARRVHWCTTWGRTDGRVCLIELP